jgi:hypothetical protein
VLGETITLADWREIVARAVADAKRGDPAARAWVSRYVLGSHPSSLLTLAVDESAGRAPGDEVDALADEVRRDLRLKQFAKDALGGNWPSNAGESTPHDKTLTVSNQRAAN